MALTQGFFKPQNPQKYKGDPTKIVYRSSWELKLMLKLDQQPNVLWWKSEETIIPYKSPIDGKWHRYFPDFLVCVENKDGNIETIMIEVKPANQTIEPKRQEKTSRKYLREVFTWGINSSKWRAANEYCKDRGWRFHIFTEKELGIKW